MTNIERLTGQSITGLEEKLRQTQKEMKDASPRPHSVAYMQLYGRECRILGALEVLKGGIV